MAEFVCHDCGVEVQEEQYDNFNGFCTECYDIRLEEGYADIRRADQIDDMLDRRTFDEY
jgi:endogenous inhibitor of DNA gyrase (YacG/DUF329 family)